MVRECTNPSDPQLVQKRLLERAGNANGRLPEGEQVSGM